MKNCKVCGSHAINPGLHARESNVDLDLCDVCYYHVRAYQWKANHDNQVAKARILMERPDLPIERIQAYKHMCKMQAVVDAAIELMEVKFFEDIGNSGLKLVNVLRENGFIK